MDDIVHAALKKWPNVPHAFGWLGLDDRGHWYLRDEATQRAGAFPAVRGSRVEPGRLLDFIGRNYAADETGRWFFQNGPQRVYVALALTPWIWRLQWQDGTLRVASHTGIDQPANGATWLDDEGRLYLQAPLGFGLVHSQDMHAAAQAVETGQWAPQPLAAALAPQRFGFVRDPQPVQAGS